MGSEVGEGGGGGDCWGCEDDVGGVFVVEEEVFGVVFVD